LKYQRTDSFKRDYKGLPEGSQDMFKAAVRSINQTYAIANKQWPIQWPATLRIKPTHASGVWEMTWSFASPDGRATFEFFEEDGEHGIRWRRVGDHRVLP
jgi:hypothetical protein